MPSAAIICLFFDLTTNIPNFVIQLEYESIAMNDIIQMTGLSCGLVVVIALLLLLIFLPLLFRRRLIYSGNKFLHIIGSLASFPNAFFFAAALISTILLLYYGMKVWTVLSLSAMLVVLISSISKVMNLFRFENMFQKDNINNVALIAILIILGAFMAYIINVFGITSDNFVAYGLCGTILTLVFQDSIKGVVSYFHLRSSGLLHMGDWIQVPDKNVDGRIEDVSLVTVTVRNWDNTISSLPLSSLQTGAFRNNQEMADRKTTGRHMIRSFTVDMNSIHTMTQDDVKFLKELMDSYGEDTISLKMSGNGTSPMLNIHLFRMYLRHWLMTHDDISRLPCLSVRLMEPTAEGLPLQVYTYITSTDSMPFDLIQSEITEHILLTMSWFGLRLYQKPSGQDLVGIINGQADERQSE